MRALRAFVAEAGSFDQARPDMKPALDTTSEWGWFGAVGRQGTVILSLFLGLSVAQATSTNFMGDFGEAFWTAQPQLGSVTFTNSDTELALAGPNAPTTERNSLDGILYNGPLPGGLTVGGTVQFHWAYDSGDALSTSEADIAWSPPGGGLPGIGVLAQGGPGVILSGDYSTPLLLAGTTFQFLLTTDTLANKLSGTLIITDFQFQPEIPEPSTGALLAGVLVSIGGARWRRCRRQASRQ
jgi:hypothetical protein